MSTSSNRRIPAKTLEEDRYALIGLQSLDSYAPSKSEFDTANLTTLHSQMLAVQSELISAMQKVETLRDQAAKAEHAFHDGIQGAKVQVIAQYGEDALEVQLLGLKRKSERRRPNRRPPTPAQNVENN